MSDFEPTTDQLNAIDYSDSMVVIAKPGSGKTYVVSEKIRGILPNLPTHQGVIAISYTNKASTELKKRSTRNGINQKSSFFGTIDKFCDVEIIIPFLSQMWGRPTEEITVTKISNLGEEEQLPFSDMQLNQVSLDDLEAHLEIVKSYFKKGLLFLETNGALALYVLTNSVACQNYVRSRYSHIFIDEYQDSGLEQHKLFLKLKELGLVAVAVGDADQSIFQFSGKDSTYLLELVKSGGFRSFPVSINHRCHSSIINYSMRLLSKDASLLDAEECRVFYKSADGNQESIAVWIDSRIEDLKEKYSVNKNSEIGILVKGNASGSLVDSALKTKHRYFISHPLEVHFSLWARLFCQLLTYRFDQSVTAQEIIDESTLILSRPELKGVKAIIRKLRMVKQVELSGPIVAIAEALLPNGRSDEAVQLLEDSLTGDLADSFEPANDDEVQIMTLHKSKGLEFDVVFHMDMYEWILPAKRPGPNNDFENPVYPSLEQDLNLHYVGITRARKACFLCTSTQRGMIDFNTGQPTTRNGKPSEFFQFPKLIELRETSPS